MGGSRGFLTLLTTVLTGLAFVAVVQAHTDEHLDAEGGVHGGMLRMSGPYHLELVVSDGAATVWVMDHGNQAQSTAGARGQLLLLQGGDRIMVDLVPEGDNQLRGSDRRIKETAAPRAVLTLSMSGEAPLQVRFAELAKPAAPAADEHTHAGH